MACPPPKNDLFYFDANGLMVFTEKYHLHRGFCCKSGCRHCPYGFRQEKEKAKENESNSEGKK